MIAPLALLTIAVAGRHRRWGQAYFYLMISLYVTGLFMTLVRPVVAGLLEAEKLLRLVTETRAFYSSQPA